MADWPGTNPLVVSETGIDNNNNDNEVKSSCWRSGSIALVDESPIKYVHITNVPPAASSGDSYNKFNGGKLLFYFLS